MNIEIMIYIYLLVCLSMIGFNIVTAFILKRNSIQTVHISENFNEIVNVQLEEIKKGGQCSENHKTYMQKSLKRVGNMVAFDKMLEISYLNDPETVKKYLHNLDSVFINLTSHYCGKDSIEVAYFPYIIKKYRILSDKTIPAIEDKMMELLDRPDIYCRENALQALYTTGNCERVINAIKKIDKSDLFFHDKILCDGLLNFYGNTEELIDGLLAEFEFFSDTMKVTLLNFIRFSSSNYSEFAHTLLCDETVNDEIRYSAIRYLGKYKYEQSYNTLCRLAEGTNEEKWQYSAIASTALSAYSSDRTIEILKNNLYSKNWYIRVNSAESLKKLGITYSALSDVIDGKDRYASEILRYMFEKDEIERRR